MDVDKLRKENRKSNWKFQGEQGSFSVSPTWELMIAKKTWSFAECWRWAKPHIGPALRSFTDCRKQRWVCFSFSILCKDLKILQCDGTDLYNALSLLFKRNYMCVCVLTIFQKEASNSFSLPSTLPHPILWNEGGGGRLNGIWSFPAEKGTFSATRSMFKGLML